jgi:hypothetical protein
MTGDWSDAIREAKAMHEAMSAEPEPDGTQRAAHRGLGAWLDWRLMLTFAVFGAALALLWRGDWLLTLVAAAFLLLRAAWWARARWAESTALLREMSEPGGRHHRP